MRRGPYPFHERPSTATKQAKSSPHVEISVHDGHGPDLLSSHYVETQYFFRCSVMGRGGDGKQTSSVRRITAAEVAKHRSAGDAWLSIRGKVRDVLGRTS
jgi:cytochrome b involved in lipid metabolism